VHLTGAQFEFACLLFVRSATECKKHQEQKQAKARNLREKLLAEKADRLHMLTKKVCNSLPSVPVHSTDVALNLSECFV